MAKSNEWILLSDSFTLPISATKTSPKPHVLTMGSIILGGSVDIFPTYEGTSLIQLLLPSEAESTPSKSSAVSSNLLSRSLSSPSNSPSSSSSTFFPSPPSIPATPTNPSATITASSTSSHISTAKRNYLVQFLQNKVTSHPKMTQELIFSSPLRALEYLGQGAIRNDPSTGTSYEDNELYFLGGSNELMRVDLNSLLAQAFESLLRQLLDAYPPNPSASATTAAIPDSSAITSCPLVLCFPSTMSLQAKGRVIESILNSSRISATAPAFHVRSVLRLPLPLNLSPSSSPPPPPPSHFMSHSTTAAITIAFLKSLYSPTPSLSALRSPASFSKILQHLKQSSLIRQNGGDPFDGTLQHSLAASLSPNLEQPGEGSSDDEETNMRLLVVEVGEEFIAASIVEVENSHLFAQFEDPTSDPHSPFSSSPYGTCTIRILGSSGSSFYGWTDADLQFTIAVARKEWRYLYDYYLSKASLPATLRNDLQSLDTVLHFVSSSRKTTQGSYGGGLRSSVSLHHATSSEDPISFSLSSSSSSSSALWTELREVISSCFYSFLKSEGDKDSAVEESIDSSLCLMNIQKAIRVYLRSYLRDFLENYRSKHRGDHLMRAGAGIGEIIERVDEFSDEAMVCVRDDVDGSPSLSPPSKGQARGAGAGGAGGCKQRKSVEYERLEKLYLGCYQRRERRATVASAGGGQGNKTRTLQEMITVCIQQAIAAAQVRYTDEESSSQSKRGPAGAAGVGRDGWKHAFRPSSSTASSTEEPTTDSHNGTPSTILPFDSVVLHVESRQVKSGERSLNDLPEQNSGRGSIKVPGIREILESIVRSLLIRSNRKRTSSSSSQSLKHEHRVPSASATTRGTGTGTGLKSRSSRSHSEPKLPLTAMTMSTYASALSRTNSKRTTGRASRSHSSSHTTSSNRKLPQTQRPAAAGPFLFEVSVGCLWEGTCFAAMEYGQSLRIYECPPTIGLRLVQQDLPISSASSASSTPSSSGSASQRQPYHQGDPEEMLWSLFHPSLSSPLPTPVFPLSPIATATTASAAGESSWNSERLRTESWDTVLSLSQRSTSRRRNPLETEGNLLKSSSNLSPISAAAAGLMSQSGGSVTSSRIVWAMGNTPRAALEIRPPMNDLLENESDDDQFYLSHIDRYPCVGETGLSSHSGAGAGAGTGTGDLDELSRFVLEEGEEDNLVEEDLMENDLDLESDTRSVSSATSSYSYLSEHRQEEGEGEDEDEEETAGGYSQDDGFDSEGHRGIQFFGLHESTSAKVPAAGGGGAGGGGGGGGYNGKYRIALRYHPLPSSSRSSSRSLLSFSKNSWFDLWTAYPLDLSPATSSSVSSSQPTTALLTTTPHSTLDLRRLLYHHKQLSSDNSNPIPQISLPHDALSAAITRQDTEALPLSAPSPASSLVHDLDSREGTGANRSISSPLRHSKSLTSLTSLLNSDSLLKRLPSATAALGLSHSSHSTQSETTQVIRRRQWVLQIIQHLPLPFPCDVSPSGRLQHDPLSVAFSLPLPSKLLTPPVSTSVCPSAPQDSCCCDLSLTLTVHPLNSFVSCELHPITLSIQDPPPADSSATSTPPSSSIPPPPPAVSSSVKKRRSSLGSDPLVQKKKDEKLNKKKKIQRIKSLLRYGCGGLFTLLLCCLVLFFVTSHVRKQSKGEGAGAEGKSEHGIGVLSRQRTIGESQEF